jgi:hypothetical protein
MRVPLIALLAIACTTRAWGSDRAASWLSIHTSTDGLTVISPQVAARGSVRTVELQAGWDADVITGASVDVRTSASPRGYTEVRQGLALGTTWRPQAGTALAFRYTPSWEPDYESETFSASATDEWMGHRLTTIIGVRGSFDRIGRVGSSRDTWRSLDTGGLELGLGWVFSPRTVGHVTVETQLARGFQASPYRFVRVGGFGVPEQAPDARERFALAAGLRHALGRRWFAAASVRFYDDSWSVASHAEELDFSWAAVRDRVVVGASARFYGQSAASFYRSEYAFAPGGIPSLRTADKLLAPSMSVLGAMRASIAWRNLGLLDELRATAKLEIYEQRLFDFQALSSRAAVILSFGIAGEL